MEARNPTSAVTTQGRIDREVESPGRRESRRWETAVWLFLGLGVLVRLVRYLVDYPIWHDEAFLACSLWDRDYVDLLRPLDYGQVAPWLFLAIERTVVKWLGYSELTLRFFPHVCGLLSVVVFWHVARRLLDGKARAFAVGIFACSFYLIRHGAEIKPYATDLLASLTLLAPALEWRRNPGSSRWLWVLSALAPVLVAISYPAVFVAGGISLALAPSALRSGRRAARLGWMVYNLLFVAAFVAVYLSSTVFQASAILDTYRNGCWADAFPPSDRPWMLPVWLLDVHTGTMMAYPAGDKHGGSTLTFLCVLAGCAALYRQGRTTALEILLSPFALGLLASFLGRYPYGGAPRVMLYLAPAICLLAGLGLADLLSRIQLKRLRHLVTLCVLVSLGMIGAGLIVRDVTMPYRVFDDVRTRDFARWFWAESAEKGEPVCLKSDLGLVLQPNVWKIGMSAVYLFHQRVYSERIRQGRPADLAPARYGRTRPLRLVAFDRLPVDHPALGAWQEALDRDFDLTRTETYVIQPGKPGERWLRDAYVVREYLPKGPGVPALARGAADGASGPRY